MKKIIIFNILIIICFLAVLEYKFYNEFFGVKGYDEGSRLPYNCKTKDVLEFSTAYYPVRYREPSRDFKHVKKPIMLIGCSYTFGQWLKFEDTFGAKLQNLTGRWVYNMGSIGQDHIIMGMLMDVEEKQKRVKHVPEYVIYTYMFHHIVRTERPFYYNWLRQKGFIPKQKYNPLYRLYTYSHIKDTQLDKTFFDDKDFILQKEIFFKIVKGMKKICDKIYPNSKFVVLVYSDVPYDMCENLWASVDGDEYRMNKLFEFLDGKEMKEKLKDEGIEVITTEELIGRKMTQPQDRVQNDPNRPHPAPAAWDLVVPKLIERLKL